MRATYFYLFFLVLILNLLFSGGRLASSDELAVFLTAESLVERGDLAISPDLVNNGNYGRDGRFYNGSGIAQPVLSIPLYLAGKFLTGILPISEPLKVLTIRSCVSLFNQITAGLIAIAMFAFALRLGYEKRIAVFLTLGLLFSTNLFPYSKSFMREPQLLLCLLSATYFLYTFKLTRNPKYILYSGVLCGIGFLTRVTFIINLPLAFLYLLAILRDTPPSIAKEKEPRFRSLLVFSAPIAVAILINFLYNYVQFGDILTTGYSGRGGFTTPLLVGMYGLLFSSGKSIFLYAPLAVLSFASLRSFSQSNRSELYLFGALFLVHVLFFGKFVAWAGDGSWGPRYLIPTLPFFLLPIGAILAQSKISKRIALGLAGLGVIIQIGGVSIYLGNYLREIGEFPYTKNFDDPEFLYKSHFIPNYSPLVGHWRILGRNVAVNLSEKRPSLRVEVSDKRIPLSEKDAEKLLYTLDFWFMYALYVGVNPGPIFALVGLLVVLCITFGFKMTQALARV